LTRVIRANEREKKRIENQLRMWNIESIPSATNFLLIRVGSKAKLIYRRLLQKGVIVRTMEAWGLNQYLRVTIGSPKENGRFLALLEHQRSLMNGRRS